jgi:hypothetical protein
MPQGVYVSPWASAAQRIAEVFAKQDEIARGQAVEAEKARQFEIDRALRQRQLDSEQAYRLRQAAVDEGNLQQRIAEGNKPGPIGTLYQVADPNDPNKYTYQPAGAAIGQQPWHEPKPLGALYQVDNGMGGATFLPGDQAVNKTAYRPPVTPPTPPRDRFVASSMIDPQTGQEVPTRTNLDTGKVERLDTGGLVPKTTQKPATGAQNTTFGFYKRARAASDDLGRLDDAVAQMGLLDQAQLEYAPNFAQTQVGQSYRQAQRAFTEARLRKESGATVTPQELALDAQTYFVQPGDSPETIAQKKAGRQVVLDSLAVQSGKAYEDFYGEPYPTPARAAAAKKATESGAPAAAPAGGRRYVVRPRGAQ